MRRHLAFLTFTTLTAAAVAACIGYVSGCTHASPGTQPAGSQRAPVSSLPNRPAPTAEEARRAVVELIRARPNTFIGNPDPDRLAALPLTDRGDGTYAFGAIVVNPAAAWYNATIGQDAPELYEYAGTIAREGGKWVASEPRVTRAHQRP